MLCQFTLSKSLSGHDEPVHCLAIHPGGDILLSGGNTFPNFLYLVTTKLTWDQSIRLRLETQDLEPHVRRVHPLDRQRRKGPRYLCPVDLYGGG